MAERSARNAEQLRMDAQRAGRENWRLWGPYLAERAWGTVREDYSADGDAWEYLASRSGALARLPLERRRPGRHLRRGAAALLRAGAVERQRPDPQGARLRPDRPRGQPRRGREGVLLLPRRHAEPQLDALPLQVSAGRVSVRGGSCRRTRAAVAIDPPFSLLDTGVFDDSRYWDVEVCYAKASPEEIHVRIIATNRGPDTATLHLLPTLWFRNTWSWGGDPPSRASASADISACRAMGGARGSCDLGHLLPVRAPRRPSRCSPRTKRNAAAAVGRRERIALREGCIPSLRRRRRSRCGQSRETKGPSSPLAPRRHRRRRGTPSRSTSCCRVRRLPRRSHARSPVFEREAEATIVLRRAAARRRALRTATSCARRSPA